MPIYDGDLLKELPAAFGKLWSFVEAFKVEGGDLFLISQHPAFHWETRLQKKSILGRLSAHGIKNIHFKTKLI